MEIKELKEQFTRLEISLADECVDMLSALLELYYDP